jgi:hypothetical protein
LEVIVLALGAHCVIIVIERCAASPASILLSRRLAHHLSFAKPHLPGGFALYEFVSCSH